jgi:HlyD family secretion protein
LAASFNTPTLFLIANDLTKMQIDALVSEADIGNVAVGQNVNFLVDAFSLSTFRGKVSQLRYGAITNQNVINYDCVIEVNNSDLKLLPSMTANVSIIIAERDDILKVPNAALRFRPPDAPIVTSRTNGVPRSMAQGQQAAADSDSGGAVQRQGGPRAGADREAPGAARAAEPVAEKAAPAGRVPSASWSAPFTCFRQKPTQRTGPALSPSRSRSKSESATESIQKCSKG